MLEDTRAGQLILLVGRMAWNSQLEIQIMIYGREETAPGIEDLVGKKIVVKHVLLMILRNRFGEDFMLILGWIKWNGWFDKKNVRLVKFAKSLPCSLWIVHHVAMQMPKQLMVHQLGFALLTALCWSETIMKKMANVLNVIMPVSHARTAKITIALNVLTDWNKTEALLTRP